MRKTYHAAVAVRGLKAFFGQRDIFSNAFVVGIGSGYLTETLERSFAVAEVELFNTVFKDVFGIGSGHAFPVVQAIQHLIERFDFIDASHLYHAEKAKVIFLGI